MIGRRGGQLKILSKEEIYDIHISTLDVLERVGIRVESEEALKLLDEIGAIVDYRS